MPDSVIAADESLILPDLLSPCAAAQKCVDAFAEAARARMAVMVSVDGKISGGRLNEEQFAGHGLSWIMTYATGFRALLHWAKRLDQAGQRGELG